MAYSFIDRDRILNEIFDFIEDGLSLRKSLNQVKISSKTFYEWIDGDDEKVKQYARACEERAEAILDEMINIVDDSDNDVTEIDLGDGLISTKVNSEHIQRSRLRYDARKWLVSKLNPKKYGDKIDVTTNGKEITSVTRTIIDESTNQDS
jgi:hypothetical protein